MRWFLGLLVLVNLAILAWGSLGDKNTDEGQLAMPGVGSIRLVGEARSVAQEPAAVPIPAPPRSDGVMVKPADIPVQPRVTELAEPAAKPPVAEAVQPAPVPAGVAEAQTAGRGEAGPVAPEVAAVQATAAEAQVTPEAAETAARQTAPRPVFCSRIGPFDDQGAASVVSKYLSGRGGRVESAEESLNVHVGYWVMISPQADRAAANAVATELKKKGIKDFWVMSKGQYRNGISLGVFSQQDNARAFAKRVAGKGFKVSTVDKHKKRTVVWLAYRGETFVPPKEIRARAPDGVKVEDRDCP